MSLATLTGAPVLHTDRLVLRAPVLDDFEGFADYQASERSRFTGGPLTRELAWRAFGHLVGHWVLRGFRPFVVTAGGQALGAVGPFHPEGWPEPEIAWTMWDADAEGKGHAFEAAQAARAHAYGALGWTTAISMIDPDNARSVALARRMGCTPDGTFRHERFGMCHLWRHPAPERVAA
jgi:ribosomal-protein-alanine N-acetyltransferase